MFIENISHVIEIISKFVHINCFLSLNTKKILELKEKNMGRILKKNLTTNDSANL